MQLSFSKSELLAGLLVTGLVIAAWANISLLPDRKPQPDAVAEVSFTPVALPRTADGYRIAGAWRIESHEPRLGGLSALAIDAGALLALSDSGVVIRLPRPGGAPAVAAFHDVPDGPGDPHRKSRRDSEALVRLDSGSWLIAFENRHQLWAYDGAFQGGRRVLSFGLKRWPANGGIEAIAADRDGAFVVIPEGRGSLIRLSDVEEQYPLASDGWTVSDATRLPDGRLYVLLRQVTTRGFRNAVGELISGATGWRVEVRLRLPLGALDNAEGLAAEPLPNGLTRLWIVTDDDFAWYRRTLLLAVDVPARQRPA